MARYTQDSKERVREAVDMADLVSTRTELRRAGPARLQGLCPFHDERTPSFGINPVEKVYHCFGCQASGDAFTFVMETEGVDFKGAIELLADRYGVELELEDEDPREAQRRARRERLLALLERTATYYERYLWDSREAEKAREYLSGRGLEEGVLREFRVGYAPSAWDRVLVGSRSEGFTEAELLETGLAQRSRQSGQPFDRFRERIMFPLCDRRGRVLGFGARRMRPEQKPKYLNSAEGDVYHKGRNLYATHLARAHASRAGAVIVCEGYTDVLALHQVGLKNTVGLMGTALTDEQVAELGRMASRIELALDADAAGQEAMLRAARAAQGRKLELRVVALPPGDDPAELVGREGAEALRERMAASVAFVRFRVERAIAAGDLGSPEGRDRVLEELGPIVRDLPPSAMREDLVRLAADRLSLSEALVESALGSMSAGASGGGRGPERARAKSGAGAGGASAAPAREGQATGSGGAAAPAARRSGGDRREQTERAFLALCVALPEQGEQALAELKPQEYFTSDLARRAAIHLRSYLRSPTEAVPGDDPELATLLAELSVRASNGFARSEMLTVERIQLELARLDRAIIAARTEGTGDVAELASQRDKIKVELDRAVDRAMEGVE